MTAREWKRRWEEKKVGTRQNGVCLITLQTDAGDAHRDKLRRGDREGGRGGERERERESDSYPVGVVVGERQ